VEAAGSFFAGCFAGPLVWFLINFLIGWALIFDREEAGGCSGCLVVLFCVFAPVPIFGQVAGWHLAHRIALCIGLGVYVLYTLRVRAAPKAAGTEPAAPRAKGA
jgi:hypothetical protein